MSQVVSERLRQLDFSISIGAEGWRVAAIYDTKWQGANGCLEGGIVAVFHPEEPLQPLAGAIADEAT
jgi:hypothetical protein